MGKKTIQNRTRREANAEQKAWMQLLRSLGCNIDDIATDMGFSRQTVYNHTTDATLPMTSIPTTATVMLSLLSRLSLQAHTAITEDADLSEHAEYSRIIGRHADTFQKLIDTGDQVTARASAEALQKIIVLLKEHESEHASAIRVLQAEYDRILEEL